MMNQVRPGGGMGRGAPVEDPARILQALRSMLQGETEFPIKVEGTHTLPYTARVQKVDARAGLMHLKLIRPLPHELAEGAAFEMLFSAGDQRYEAPMVFRGREGYLLYRFTIPTLMAPSDRRRHKRYPFRPREKAYVVAQDASVPGYAISGPLVNLSLGGLALRVDRIMRLDDHLRVTPGLAFFDRGKSFPMLKIRDLPNLPAFDARGIIAFAEERGGEVVVGIQFGELRTGEVAELQSVLTIRENMKRVSSVLPVEPRGEGTARRSAPTGGPTGRVAPAGTLTPDALTRLGRRCRRVILAMTPGTDRDDVLRALREGGYCRLEAADTLDEALDWCRGDQGQADPLLVTLHPGEDLAPLGRLRDHQRQVEQELDLQVALISREVPTPAIDDPLLQVLPWPVPGDLSWRPPMDALAGLDS